MDNKNWYNIIDLNVFNESLYLVKFLKNDGGIPLINVKWNVNNFDYVNQNDVLFTSDVDIDAYQHNKYTATYDEEIYKFLNFVVKSPKNGFVFVKNKETFFECRLNKPICGIFESKEKCYNVENNNLFIIRKEDYDLYKLYKINDDIKIFIHYTLNSEEKKQNIENIINWLLGGKDNGLSYWAYNDNQTNGKGPTFYINEDLTIDCFTDRFYVCIKNKGCLPDFIKFRKVNGDFHIYFYDTDKNKETTLKGCPLYVNGHFECHRNNLNKFEYMPLYIEGNCDAKRNNINSFIGIPKYIGGILNISNNSFTDEAWDYAKDNIDGEFGDYNIKKNLFVKYRKELF